MGNTPRHKYALLGIGVPQELHYLCIDNKNRNLELVKLQYEIQSNLINNTRHEKARSIIRKPRSFLLL